MASLYSFCGFSVEFSDYLWFIQADLETTGDVDLDAEPGSMQMMRV